MGTEAPAGRVLDAIVLAAGYGRRFGGAKLTAPWRGGVLIDGALAAAFAAPVRQVVVVTGEEPLVAEAVVAWAERRAETDRLRLVHAKEAALGMSASLRAGLRAVPEDVGGVFVFLGDMPLIPPGLALALARSLLGGALAVAPSRAGRRGHPVLFDASLFDALGDLQGDEGARTLLSGLGDRLALVETQDAGLFADVDAPGDLQALG